MYFATNFSNWLVGRNQIQTSSVTNSKHTRNKKGGTFTHTFIGRWEDDPFMVTPTRPPIPFVVNLGG